MLSFIRYVFAPVIIRFQDTDALKETLNFLDACDQSKLDARLVKLVNRTSRLIAKELLRRGVPIWKF